MAVFVPDASVTLPWCFEDEPTPFTESLLNRIRAREEVMVPSHWSAEVLNSLLQAKKRGRISKETIHRVRNRKDLYRGNDSLPTLLHSKQYCTKAKFSYSA